MDELAASRVIFETLSDIRPIGTALVSMWSLGNKYARIPFLRFRFKELNKDDVIYQQLKTIIENYPGKVRWCLVTREDVRNYVLLPVTFERTFWENIGIHKEQVLTLFTEKEYNDWVDDIIADVPDLARYIRDSFK